jgi:hypothetical protein|nr:MAG TPA_asm: hypothetical protein [Caudoviricetes sp.]
MDNEELTKVIDNMQKINEKLLKQNDKLYEELKHSNRDFFVLAGLITITLLLVLYAMW